jgi:alcohol dehydrogenase class IV
MAETWEHRFAGTERVVAGPGSVEALPELCDERGMRRVVLVTGRSLREKTPVISRVEQILGGRHVTTYSGVREFVPAGAVRELTALLREHGADGVVSVGGGSPIDASKAALYHHDEGNSPQIAVPTTLSAAEFTPTAGITDEQTRRKSGVVHPRLTPRAVVLDPEITIYTPDRLWLSSGIRALDHAVETVYAPEHDRFATDLALRAIALLRESLPACRHDPADLDARATAQRAAWYSGMGLAAVTVRPSHPMGRVLGSAFGIGHGITSCVLLPAAIDWMAARDPESVGPLATAFDVQQPTEVGDAVRAFAAQLGLPTTLQEAGLDSDALHEFIHMIPEEWAPIARAAFVTAT